MQIQVCPVASQEIINDLNSSQDSSDDLHAAYKRSENRHFEVFSNTKSNSPLQDDAPQQVKDIYSNGVPSVNSDDTFWTPNNSQILASQSDHQNVISPQFYSQPQMQQWPQQYPLPTGVISNPGPSACLESATPFSGGYPDYYTPSSSQNTLSQHTMYQDLGQDVRGMPPSLADKIDKWRCWRLGDPRKSNLPSS